MSGIRLKVALGALALASGPMALSAWNEGMGKGGFSTPVGGNKWFATRPGFFETAGIHDPELSPTGSVFNWTDETATVRFDRLERSRPTTVAFRIQGRGEDSRTEPEVIFSVDGVETRRLAVPTTPKRVPLDLPPRAGRGAVVSINVEGSVGVMVENVRLLPVGGSTVPLPREAIGALAFVAIAVYLAGLMAGFSPWMALVLSVLEATLVSWLSLTGGAFLGRYSETLVWISAIGLVLSLGAVRIWDLRWRRAWIVVFLVSALKLSALSHPQLIDADASFHAGNLRRVLAGDWFFTSATPPPAISFPYPQALSVAALPFAGVPADKQVTLLRVIVVVAEIVAAFAFSVAVAMVSTQTMGAMTFILITIAAEGVGPLFVGNLANLFGDAFLILGCSFLIIRRPAFASFSLLAGSLSHLGTLLLGAPLSFFLALGQGPLRTDALRRTAPVFLALAAAFALYYRRFMDVVIGAWDRMIQLKSAEAVGPMTAPWTEKLGRLSGGGDSWITLVVLIAIAAGVATWPKDRRPLAKILCIWMLVIVGFTLLGLWSPVQVRSGLSARPAVAALCASGVCSLWARGGWSKALAGTLVALMAFGFGYIAYGFFPVKPA